MGSDLDMLKRLTITLEKTWSKWFNTSNKKKRKKLQMNFEFLLKEARFWTKSVEEEWRSAFPKPPKKLKYDQKVQPS